MAVLHLKQGLLCDKCRICHVLTVEIKLNESWKMLFSEPLASLIKFYPNSQQMSDSFYHMTESIKLN